MTSYECHGMSNNMQHKLLFKLKNKKMELYITDHLCQKPNDRDQSRYAASLGMRPANERRRYNVTMPLNGWAHT